ncbi:hypothetical protein KAR91_22815 [Candidatus Pacearchaeota archaeon]|nr:hypothetical protein [Candidatus Pacearchaeota archaeon]
MAKIKVKNSTKCVITLKSQAGSDKPFVNILSENVLTFNSEIEYAPYANCVSALKKSHVVEVLVGDAKAKTVPATPAKKVIKRGKVTKKATRKSKKQKRVDIQKALDELQVEFNKEDVTADRKQEIKKAVIELKEKAKKLK